MTDTKKIAVIGAGVTGTTTAYQLARKGADVTVFESNPYPAMETSYANGGQLSASNAEVWNSVPTLIKGVQWMLKKLQLNAQYIVFGKPSIFNRKINMAHPEIELQQEAIPVQSVLYPVYPSTEKLRSRFLDSKGISKLQQQLLSIASQHIKESLSEGLRQEFKLAPKLNAIANIHFPKADTAEYIKSWDGVRCAVMQGGQGDIKHWAFNDPLKREGPYKDRPPTPEDAYTRPSDAESSASSLAV